MCLSKRKCQPSLLTDYVLSFKTYSKHLNHLNFETENTKIGSNLLTALSKQKTISVQTVPFLQMYLIPCPEVTLHKKNSKLRAEKQLSGLQVLAMHIWTHEFDSWNPRGVHKTDPPCITHKKSLFFLILD